VYFKYLLMRHVMLQYIDIKGLAKQAFMTNSEPRHSSDTVVMYAKQMNTDQGCRMLITALKCIRNLSLIKYTFLLRVTSLTV
jgi:hypothetical protein